MENDRWDDMLLDRVPDEEVEQLVKEAASQLSAGLKKYPSFHGTAVQAIERVLDDKADPQTLGRLLEALSSLLGADVARLLAWISLQDVEQRVAQVVERVDDATKAFVREVAGLFSAQIRQATQLGLSIPDDWSFVRYFALLDQITGQYRTRFDFRKYNGDQIILEMSPDSLLSLMGIMSAVAVAIGNRDVFTEQTVNDFKSAEADLQRMLNQPIPSTTVDVSSS